jgi:hypothetical protein
MPDIVRAGPILVVRADPILVEVSIIIVEGPLLS